MSSLDPARRSLSTAARALDEFRSLSGALPPEEASVSNWRIPAETGARAALDEARARVAELSADLDKARRAAGAAADAAATESREASQAREEAAALQARAAGLEAELAACREALDAAAARERRAEAEAREAAAAWTARFELLERDALTAARAEAQRELAAAKAKSAAVEAELEAARATASALETEARAQREAAESRAASRADSRANADFAQRRAAEAASRASLLEAECVRLEKLRHAAEQAAADAEAQGRDVAEALRREVRTVHAALDRAAVEAGAAEAKSRVELEALRSRLEGATTRLQALEREKHLETARGAGDSAAVQTELLRTQAVAASLRQELNAVRAASERQEEALRRELSAGRLALDEARRALADRPAAESRRELEAALIAEAAPPAAPPVEAVEPAPFVQPSVEPMLDPGWARLVRLVRPPVDSAYAHLRRLSATALTAGQKALLRMAAASVAQASDSLSSIELALEEGPAPGSPSPVLPVLESSLAAWESAFRGRGVAISREFASPLPDSAHNAKELRIALHHVLRNVLEAVPRGGRLAVRAVRGPDGGLRVEFADDGPGFPTEWLAHRFEPFSASRRGRAGLGLSLVRRTLRRWGGDAEASNGPAGRGARLTLSFAPPPPSAPAAK